MEDCVDDNSLGVLNDTLIINDILGEGGYSIVYKVTDKETNKEYAAKIIEKFCKNEYKINKILSNTQNSHFIKLITYSQGDLRLKTGSDFKPYFLFEFASKGTLTSSV